MEKTVIIVSAVVGSLGVLSAILGFSAEGTKLTPYDILVYGDDCIYPPNPALALAVCAAVFLLLAQITVSALGGCCGCCRPRSRAAPSETKRIVGIICAVVSWTAAGVAWVLLLEGAVLNANVARDTAPNCSYLKDSIFAGAAVLTLAATALGVASYIMFRGQPAASTGASDKPCEPDVGISMTTAHPQVPPPQALSEQQPAPYPQHQGQAGQGQVPPPTAPPEGCEQAQPLMNHPQSSPAAAASA